MNLSQMQTTARALVAAGKGILAADESFGTIEKRFTAIDIPSTEETRRDYRQMLITTPGLGKFISGVILFDETIRQRSTNGVPFVEVLKEQGMIPGIKVDKGAKPLAHFPNDRITEGLDGLRKRLVEYAQLGARFTKWRAVISIGHDWPSTTALRANAHALARFAALSQEEGLVPIVEPEVLMDGDHTLESHRNVTETIINLTFEELFAHRVELDAILLKPNMILPGEDCPFQTPVQQVAEATLNCLLRSVPPAVPGIVFLSGGQTDVQATEHLNAINRLDRAPWQISFSFARALQNSALKIWAGKSENVAHAQHALFHRAECNSAARFGRYTENIERAFEVEEATA
jgi:fructose-bisphosphate aldolase, class I